MTNAIYEEQVLKIDFFSKYKNLVPFIGENYRQHKILIVRGKSFSSTKISNTIIG